MSDIEKVKVDKRKECSPEKLEQLKRMRLLSAEKKRLKKEEELKIQEEHAKNSVIKEVEVKKQPVEVIVPMNQPIENLEPASQPVVEIKTKTPVVEKRTSKLSLSDDAVLEIKNIIKEAINPSESKESKKQRKLEESYQYFIQRLQENKPKVGVRQPSKLSLFD